MTSYMCMFRCHCIGAGLPTREQQWVAKRISAFLSKVRGEAVDVLPPAQQAPPPDQQSLPPGAYFDDFDDS